MEIFVDTEFFKKLKDTGITKTDKINKNLRHFLCVDTDSAKTWIMADKFKASILHMNTCPYF